MGARKRCGNRQEAPSSDAAPVRSLLVLGVFDTAAFVAAAWLCVSFPESLEPPAAAAPALAARAGSSPAPCR